MVKCDACLLSNDVRYSRPPGKCEECSVVTPYSDRLCAACSDAMQRCQCCRSKRVQALVSIPAATAPIVEALAAAQQHQRRRETQSAVPFEEAKESTAYAAPSRTTANTPAPRTSPSVSAASRALEGEKYLATSPYHYQNATTYTLPLEEENQLNATAPIGLRTEQRLTLHTADSRNCSSQQHLISHHPTLAPPSAGLVLLSPSGKLVPATVTPLSPRMAVRQNASGQAPQVRVESDAEALVHSWSKAELISEIFAYYCNHKSTKLTVLLNLTKMRHLALDSGMVGPADHARGVSALSANRLDILYTQSTRPLSGQKSLMTEEQFFELLGAIALWKYGGGATETTVSAGAAAAANGGGKDRGRLIECLERLFAENLTPLAVEIVHARRGGLFTRSEAFEPVVASILLRYEESLKRIFIRFAREHYADAPRVDERESHPLVEEGWKAFCRAYGFFPDLVGVSSVLRVFLATASGLIRHGQQERPGMSYDDFMHGLFQLAQLSFTLTPNALPIERVELLLSKIDEKARELAFMPVGQRARMDPIDKRADKKLLTTGGTAGNEMVPYTGEASGLSTADGSVYAALYSLFSSRHLSCARDLYNLYCNSPSQSSYTEIMRRTEWVRLLRESQLVDGRTFTGADADILFAHVLSQHSHARPRPESRAGSKASSGVWEQSPAVGGAVAFAHGRTMTFPLFLTGLMDASVKKFPHTAVTAAVRQTFDAFFLPLLQHKIASLQQASRQVDLPLGAGTNGAGAMNATPAKWGRHDGGATDAAWNGEQLPSGDPAATPLYPNHPSASPITLPDGYSSVESLLTDDKETQSLFSLYAKPLQQAFYRASWEGVEASSGVAVPRISSSLLIHASPSTAMTNQTSWDVFLQQKSLLSEHAFRRWLASVRVTPELIAHKQVTLLFREANVGFDRRQNQFVLNYTEFQSILLRIALLSFSGSGYAKYSTPASKMELLIFLLDQNSNGGMGFRGFKFLPPAAGEQQHSEQSDLMSAATNMGAQLWERRAAGTLGVKALLLGENPPSSDPVPQDWGHGAKGPHAILSPSHSTVKGHFTTSLLTPRVQHATTFRVPDPEKPYQSSQNQAAHSRRTSSGRPPSQSPTRLLFENTPFHPETRGKTTKFAQNVPKYSDTPLGSPRRKMLQR